MEGWWGWDRPTKDVKVEEGEGAYESGERGLGREIEQVLDMGGEGRMRGWAGGQ